MIWVNDLQYSTSSHVCVKSHMAHWVFGVFCFVLFFFQGGTEVITEDDYQNGHPDLEAASSGRLGVGRDKMVYMAVKNHPKEEEDDEDDSDDDEDEDIGMPFLWKG